ncbi:MAG: hypothetical protein ACOC7K_00585 [bacterium]
MASGSRKFSRPWDDNIIAQQGQSRVLPSYVIERILKHRGLWDRPPSRVPIRATGPSGQPVLDLQYVDEDEFLMAL